MLPATVRRAESPAPDPTPHFARMATLALHGGTPTICEPLRPYPAIGAAERRRVLEVIESGVLSGFYGSDGPEFLGGARVRELETLWCAHFGCRHAVSVNSATTGLVAALVACGVGPGDEVILPCWTMSGTAMAILLCGAEPVFCDVEPETYGLDPARVQAALSPRTRAVLAVNLFGHPARLHELRALCDARGVLLVEDNAQAPGASERGVAAGTVGHVGVFSLNYHKHVHCGEGGICTTQDDALAERLRMARNHGENVVEARGGRHVDIAGSNYRLTELSAAVALAQLEAIESHVARRERLAAALTREVTGLDGIHPPQVRAGCRHVSYVWALQLDPARLGVGRTLFSEALAAEGFPHFCGYVRPLQHLPIFHQPSPRGHPPRRFRDTGCPVAEHLHRETWLGFETCAYDLTEHDAPRLAEAIRKVHALRAELAARRPEGASR